MRRATSALRALFVGPLLLPLLLYRRVVSPFLAPRCRYHPTCSRYAVDALRQHGPFWGLVLAGWRVLRCNPWSDGGVDPVPADHPHPFRRHPRTR